MSLLGNLNPFKKQAGDGSVQPQPEDMPGSSADPEISAESADGADSAPVESLSLNFAKVPPQGAYNEGDTLTHEVGHWAGDEGPGNPDDLATSGPEIDPLAIELQNAQITSYQLGALDGDEDPGGPDGLQGADDGAEQAQGQAQAQYDTKELESISLTYQRIDTAQEGAPDGLGVAQDDAPQADTIPAEHIGMTFEKVEWADAGAPVAPTAGEASGLNFDHKIQPPEAQETGGPSMPGGDVGMEHSDDPDDDGDDEDTQDSPLLNDAALKGFNPQPDPPHDALGLAQDDAQSEDGSVKPAEFLKWAPGEDASQGAAAPGEEEGIVIVDSMPQGAPGEEEGIIIVEGMPQGAPGEEEGIGVGELQPSEAQNADAEAMGRGLGEGDSPPAVDFKWSSFNFEDDDEAGATLKELGESHTAEMANLGNLGADLDPGDLGDMDADFDADM